MPDGVRRPLKYLAAGLCVWTVLVAMQAWIGWFSR
jgi:hypothetical protein